MKNFLKSKFFVAGIAALAFGACTDLKLTETDSVVSSSTGGFKAIDPVKFLASAYNDLDTYTDQANIYALTEQATDEMIPPTRGVDWGDNGVWRTLDAHTWDPTHSWNANAWNQLHGRAFKCTQILASSPTPAVISHRRAIRLRTPGASGDSAFRDDGDDLRLARSVSAAIRCRPGAAESVGVGA